MTRICTCSSTSRATKYLLYGNCSFQSCAAVTVRDGGPYQTSLKSAFHCNVCPSLALCGRLKWQTFKTILNDSVELLSVCILVNAANQLKNGSSSLWHGLHACQECITRYSESTFRPQTKLIWSVSFCARLMLLLYKTLNHFQCITLHHTVSTQTHYITNTVSTAHEYSFYLFLLVFIFGWYGENSLQLNVSRTKEILCSIFGDNFTHCAVQPKHQAYRSAHLSFSNF